MKQRRNQGFRRAISVITALALLSGSIPGALAEGDAAPVCLCGQEEHIHSPECFERILTCGLEETEPVTEIHRTFVSGFHTHHHGGGCYTDGELTCGYAEDVYYHTHNEFCLDGNGKTVCGLQESKPHKHTDECYETIRVLSCGQEETEGHRHTAECTQTEYTLACGQTEEAGHTHTETCYTDRKELSCGLEEAEAHHHGDSCWETTDTLSCGLEENEEHQHTEACHTIERKLACGLEETDGHRHTEECYTVYHDLTCGLEEKEGHTHSEACYTQTEIQICGLPETEGHRHSEECYTEEKRLVCDKPTSTHRHTEDCYETDEDGNTRLVCRRPEVPVFTASEANWQETVTVIDPGHRHGEACWQLSAEPVCGKAEHIHTEACLQTEEPVKEEPAETAETPAEPEADTAGEPEAPEAENPEEPEADTAGEPEAPETEAPAEPEADTAEDPEAPEAEAPAEPEADTAEEPETPETEAPAEPEADTAEDPDAPEAEAPAEPEADTAEEPEAPEAEASGEPEAETAGEPEAPEAEEEAPDATDTGDAAPADDEEPHLFEKEWIDEDGQIYRITVRTGAHSGIPGNALLVVRLIPEGSAEYEALFGKAGETLQDDRKMEKLYAFDISLVNPDNPEEHYQPVDESLVSVSISVPDMKPVEQESEVQVLHFAQSDADAPEVLHTQNVPEGGEQQEFSFSTGSFSPFVLMKTTAAEKTIPVACDGVSETKDCIVLAADAQAIGTGGQETWYSFEDNLTLTNRPEIQGTVNLALRNGKTLTAPKGINLADGNTLVIWREQGASDSSAALQAVITDASVIDSAGIGGDGSIQKTGSLEIHGGSITAQGANFAAGIGGGNGGYSGAITILGGIVTATGGHSAAGIGGGEAGSMSGTLSIRGGTVKATGGDYGAGIGGGQYFSDNIQYEKLVGGNGGNVVIAGGTVIATGGMGASGIGGGEAGSGGTLSVNGVATVIAVSGDKEGQDADKPEAIGRGDKSERTSGSEATSGKIALSGGTKVFASRDADPQKDAPVAQDKRVDTCRSGEVKIVSAADAEEYDISTTLNRSGTETEIDETLTVINEDGTAIASAAAGTALRIQVTCRKQDPAIACLVEAVYLEKDREKKLELSGPTETEKDGIRTLTYTGKMPKAELTVTATLSRNQKTISIDSYDKTYGTVTVNTEKASPDERPIITFTCAEGYEDYWLKTLKVTGKTSQTVYAEIPEAGMPVNITNTDGDGASWQFVMPDEDVLVTGISFGRGTHYVALNGVSTVRKKCIELTGDMTDWNDSGAEDGWYVVRQDVTMNGPIHIRREVNLVLSDGTKLNAPKGIIVDNEAGGALYIWAQEKGTGSLEANGDDDAAGIGATEDIESGPIHIYGGKITARGDDDSAGIGGALRSYVHGGVHIDVPDGYADDFTTIQAWGGENGSGIGEGNGHNGGDVHIYGGTVYAWGGEDGAGIGAGQDNNLFRPIEITGGKVYAYGGKNGAGIGLGPRYADHGGNMRTGIEISGANTYVYAEGGSEDGAGIGTGEKGDVDSTIVIREATVEAVAHEGAAGIGGGYHGDTDNGSITIESGHVTVRVQDGDGAGIGSGEGSPCGEININGGVIEIYTEGKGGSLGGAKGERNGRLNLFTHALVSAGSDGNYVAAGDRVNTCWSGDVHYLKIEPCTHPGGSMVPEDHVNHRLTCNWCGFNNEPEAHSFGNDRSKADFYQCACGYSRKRLTVGKTDREGYGTILAGLSPDDMKHETLETVPGETVYVHLEPAAGARITGFSGSYYAEGDQSPRDFAEFSAFPADKGQNYQFVMPDPDDDRPELTLLLQTEGGEKPSIPDLAERGVTYLTIRNNPEEEYLVALTKEEAEQKGSTAENWKSSDGDTLDFEGIEPGVLHVIYARKKAAGGASAGPWSDPLRAITLSQMEDITFARDIGLSVGDTLTAFPMPILAANVTFQWYRDGKVISGETKNLYTLTDADINHTLKIEAVQVTDKKGTKQTAEKALRFSPSGSVILVFQAADGSWGDAITIPMEGTVKGRFALDEAYLKNNLPKGTSADGFQPVSYSFGYQEEESRREAIPKNKEIQITEDQSKLYVYFERKLFTLDFYSDMLGKGTPETAKVRYGASLSSYSSKTVTAGGYTFAGWTRTIKPIGVEYGYVTPAPGGKEVPNFVAFDLNSETMPAFRLKLYPVLIKPRVEVRLDTGAVDANATRLNMNGWRNPAAYTDQNTKAYLDASQYRSFTVVSGTALPANTLKRMAAVTRDGYEPDGWHSASGLRWMDSLTVLPVFCDSPVPETREGTSYLYYTLTLKAEWTLRKATLHYDTGEGTWSGADRKDIEPDTTVQVSGETVTPPAGQIFIGWKDRKGNYYPAGSEILYDNLDLVSAIGSGRQQNVITLTAQFFEKPHIVAFDTRGGSPVDPLLLEESDVTASLDGITTARTGGTFKGWALAPDTTETVTEVSFAGGNSVIWVYAVWENKEYAVYFSGNGGTMDGKNFVRKQYPFAFPIPKDDTPVPVREHYRFAGWKPALPLLMPAKLLIVSATWEPVSHTWTFDPAGGSAVEPVSAFYGDPVQAPADPTREGYSFMGWKSEGQYAALPEYMDGDRTYTAGWKEMRSVPEAPVVRYVTSTIIEIQPRPGEEYAITFADNDTPPGEDDWKQPDENGTLIFYLCQPNTRYHVYARYTETEDYVPSEPSAAAITKTKRVFPDAPAGTAGFRVIRMDTPDDAGEHLYQYSADKGNTWSDGQVIAGLVPGTDYRVTARWGEPRILNIYPESEATAITTDLAITGAAVSGSLRIGETLTASCEPQTAERVTWQWYREGGKPDEWIPIENAAAAAYTLTKDDAGRKLRAVATQQSRLPELEDPVVCFAETAAVTSPGTVSSQIRTEGNVPAIELNGMTETLILAIAGKEAETRRMQGENILLTVTVSDIGSSITDGERVLLGRAMQTMSAYAKNLQYFDISVSLQVGSDDPVQLTDLHGNQIRMTLTVPSRHIAPRHVVRTYYIARLHDSAAEIIAAGKDTAIGFASGLFCPYALGCSDAERGGSGGGTTSDLPYRYLANFRFNLFSGAYPEAEQERMQGYEALVNGLELRADILWNAQAQGLDIAAEILPAGRPEAAIPVHIFGNTADLCIESPLLGTRPYYLGNMEQLTAHAGQFTELTGLPAALLDILVSLCSPEAAKEGRPSWLYETQNGSVRIAAEWKQDDRVLADLDLEADGIPAVFPGETRINASLHAGGLLLPQAEMAARLTMDAKGKTELNLSVRDENKAAEPLFRAYGTVIRVGHTKDQKGTTTLSSQALKQYPDLLDENGRFPGEMLGFVTPEMTDAILQMLEAISEQGAGNFREDLDRYGIPSADENPGSD